MWLKLLIIIFGISSLTEAVRLNCDDIVTSAWWNNDIYECQSKSLRIYSKEDRTISFITRSYSNDRPLSDFDSFYAYDSTIYYFPRGLENHFGDLISISLTDSKVKEVHSDDLKPFPKLLKFSLKGNELEVLDGDLFMHNPLIHRVNFDKNKIKHVGNGFFTAPSKLEFLHFENNICYNGKAEEDRFKTMMLALNIQQKCFDIQIEMSLKGNSTEN